MSLFVMSDLHLSTSLKTNKSMEVFGRRWIGYIEKTERNWRAIVDDNDLVVIPGDISWATTTEEAKSDFTFIESLPGRKILMKGNHDFWWQTMAKLKAFCADCDFKTIDFLHNNAFIYGDYVLCGTRGWFPDETNVNIPKSADYEKLIARESMRLKMSIEEGRRLSGDREREIIAFLHFPLYFGGNQIEPFVDILAEYGIRRCYYGHIHGKYSVPSCEVFRGIEFHFISADYLDFVPKIITKE